MTALQSHYSITLDLPPCCIELSPLHPNHAFVGTYYLPKEQSSQGEESSDAVEIESKTVERQQQKRFGSIVVLKVDSDSIIPVLTYPTNYGILDLHFSPHHQHVFCTANSTRSLSLFSTSSKEPDSAPTKISVNLLSFFEPFSENTLALACQWHPFNPEVVGVSLSNGNVVLVQAKGLGSSTVEPLAIEVCASHEVEAWTLAFTTVYCGGRSQIGILSGGDDSTLQYVQEPSAGGKDDDMEPLHWKNQRIHSAGVTAILPLDSTLILTGSYDDNVRLLQIPINPAIVLRTLAKKNLDGGVWRLKVIKHWAELCDSGRKQDTDGEDELQTPPLDICVLASCMYAGMRIIRVKQTRDYPTGLERNHWDISVVAKFEEHKSMNYGSEFIFFPRDDGDNVPKQDLYTVTTSFYDKLVCLTRVPSEIFTV